MMMNSNVLVSLLLTVIVMTVMIVTPVSAEVCEDALQASFDQCVTNIVLGPSPAEACRPVSAIQTEWYACLCDRTTALEYCYDSYCTTGGGRISQKQAKEQYCSADAQLNPNRTRTSAGSTPSPLPTNTNTTGNNNDTSKKSSADSAMTYYFQNGLLMTFIMCLIAIFNL